MTTLCMSYLNYVRLLNFGKCTRVGWNKCVYTDNKDTIMMLLTGRLSSRVTTLEPN